MVNYAKNYLETNSKYDSKILKSLGKGNFGEAFLTDKNFVIKVTKDESEFLTIKNKILPNINVNGVVTPKYYETKEIGDIFIIVMGKVEKVSLTSNENILLNKFRDLIINFLELGKNISPIIDNIKEKIKDTKLQNILLGVTNILSKLKEYGINNVDFQEDNIGIIGNKYVAFDIVDDKYLNENDLTFFVKKVIKENYFK